MRFKMTLSYDGAAFSGWQIQPNAPSVQGALETALTTLTGQTVGVVGAGRTDAGVNARNYVAHFDCEGGDATKIGKNSLSPTDLCFKLNAILPQAVAVHSIEPAADDFHARFSATARQYKYYIHNRKDPFLASHSWYCRYPLDINKMNKACEYLLGVHDCSCFEKKGSDNATSICEIFAAHWEEILGAVSDAENNPETDSAASPGSACGTKSETEASTTPRNLIFTVEANRFLRNMVRAIVGTMVDIGRGTREPEYILEILDGKGDRSDAGQSVPGHALFLNQVRY